MAVIFDLDQTLVNSSSLEPLRRNRNWGAVRRRIAEAIAYSGINQSIEYLQEKEIPIAIVTNSPSFYCELINDLIGWGIEHFVCYHEVKGRRKPHPYPMQLASSKLGVSVSDIFSFGDRADDITSSNSAGATSIACFWGTEERGLLESSQFDFSLESSTELLPFLRERF